MSKTKISDSLKINLDYSDYEAIAKSMNHMAALTPEVRTEIIDYSKKVLPPEEFDKILPTARKLEDEREFYDLAEIPFWNPPPESVFVGAIAKYAALHRNSIKGINSRLN